MTQFGNPLEVSSGGQLSEERYEPNAVVERSGRIGEFDEQECAEFQAQMPARIGAGEDLQEYAHLQTCDRCRALLTDLEAIAEAARQLLPVEEPRDALWDE